MKKAIKPIAYYLIAFTLLVGAFYWSSKNWTTKSTHIVSQKIGGSLICEVSNWMDQHDWGNFVHYSYVVDNDTLYIGDGDFRVRDWYSNPQLLADNGELILATGSSNFDKLIIISDAGKTEFEFDQKFIETQGAWKRNDFDSKWNSVECKSRIINFDASDIQIIYTAEDMNGTFQDFEISFERSFEKKNFEIRKIKTLANTK